MGRRRKEEETLKLTKEQQAIVVPLLRDYLTENFDIEAGNLQLEIMTDFISEKMGAIYYNKGIADAMAFFHEKTEDLYLLMKDEE